MLRKLQIVSLRGATIVILALLLSKNLTAEEQICAQISTGFVVAGAEPRDPQHKVDYFFLKTRRFVNLIHKHNRIAIDPNSPQYLEFVKTLSSKLIERIKAIEAELGKTETIIFNVSADSELIIKFPRSKTYLLIPLDRVEEEVLYDYKWDRDYIKVHHVKFPDASSAVNHLMTKIQNLQLPKKENLLCREQYCRYFQTSLKTASPPKIFQQLSENEQKLVKTFFEEWISQIKGSFDSPIYDGNSRRLSATRYKNGLSQYLRARRIPINRRANYSVNFNKEIQVDLAQEEFDSVPWGALYKRQFVERMTRDILFLKNMSLDTPASEILISFLRIRGISFEKTDLDFIGPGALESAITFLVRTAKLLGGPFLTLVPKFENLSAELTQKHQLLRSHMSALLEVSRAQFKDITTNYFQIEGVRIPLAEYSQLPSEVKEYLALYDKFFLLNGGGQGGLPISMTGLRSLFRAPDVSESHQISSGTWTLSPETNFEPYVGLQVQYFRYKDGFSGDIVEVKNIPGYLVVTSEGNSGLHPEVRVRFPVKTSHLHILDR